MGILKAENNVSYTANNACKIYIIKQVEIGDPNFQTYLDYINGSNGLLDELGKKLININPTNSSSIKLTKLVSYSQESEKDYTKIEFNTSKPDLPVAYDSDGKIVTRTLPNGDQVVGKYSELWFYSDLIELEGCPLLDLSKEAYVFQIEGQTKSGLANVVSFNTSFSVNGQSSCSIVINNLDYKYNFKYFNEPEKYKYHLKPFFDTNDIIIIRFQKKATQEESLLNSFKKSPVDYWEDPYIHDKNDPLTTVFTGYINDVNQSFSFANGQQTMELVCTGPSKKMTWTRIFSNQATNDPDPAGALLPIAAYINPQTFNSTGQASTENQDVIKNVLLRTYSDVLNVYEIRKEYNKFIELFERSKNTLTDKEYNYYLNKIEEAKKSNKADEIKVVKKNFNDYKSQLSKDIKKSRDRYNELLKTYMDNFARPGVSDSIEILNNTYITDEKYKKIPTAIINGTSQPAYQWTFQNWTIFKSDYSTLYQFIKSIADNLQFNFYDDPYGTIHFGIPNISLGHLQSGDHPNNITQLISFSENQNTENIANVYFGMPKSMWADMDVSNINNVCIKDYHSIAQYGEKTMQPLQFTGMMDPTEIKYMLQAKMIKNNRKALSNIRINIQGEPCIKFDKYAYIKELKKLFYIESYSHSYNAGGQFTTSINGTYTRQILCMEEAVDAEIRKTEISKSINKYLEGTHERIFNSMIDKSMKLTNSNQNYINKLSQLTVPNYSASYIYNVYKTDFNYPNDPNLEFEISSLYTEDVVKSCFLDGYFWMLPFAADPYSIAKSLAELEKTRTSRINKLLEEKESQTNITNTTNSSGNVKTKTEPIKPNVTQKELAQHAKNRMPKATISAVDGNYINIGGARYYHYNQLKQDLKGFKLELTLKNTSDPLKQLEELYKQNPNYGKDDITTSK